MTPTPEEFAKFSKLSPRRKQVLALHAQGLSGKEVAQELGIAYETVKSAFARTKEQLEIGEISLLKLAVYIVRRPQIERMLREAL